MIRILLRAFMALVLVIQVTAAYGAPLSLVGLSSGTYSAGTPLEFDVSLPPVAGLGSYNVDLVLTSPTGTAGIDYFFDTATTHPSPTRYVFPSDVNFFDAANTDSPSQHRLTLTDFDFVGVDVVQGANDLVARVVVQTAVGFSGELTLAFDPAGLILDTVNSSPTPVAEFDTILSDTRAEGGTTLLPVPEPVTWSLLAASALVFACYRHS